MPEVDARCAFRRGFGHNYWRCPADATTWFWNIDNVSGVCEPHLAGGFLDGILEASGLYVPLAHAAEHGGAAHA